MIARRLPIVIALAATLVAACTTEESSTPAPTLTSTTSTSTTTTTVAPTSTSAPTTVEETTTTAASTTTLPSGPADVRVPLLIGGQAGGWLSLGAWQFDRWASAFDDDGDPITPSIGPGTAVTVTNLGQDSPATLGEFTEACFDEREGPTLDDTVAAPEPPGFGYGAVALPTPAWPLSPRQVAATATGPAAYQAIGEAAFAGDPVDATRGAIRQVVVADLDGDGDDEAIAVFEHVTPDTISGAPGDLAAVLLIDTTTRASSTAVKAFVDQGLDPAAFPVTTRYRIIDVADYNGDGRMEVAVHAWYYEGSSVIVFEYDGAALVEVLRSGCGT
jgi:hypothetical protein